MTSSAIYFRVWWILSQGVTLVYRTTVIRMDTFDKTKIKVGRFFVFIRQYAQICLYMKRHDLGQSHTELLWRHFFAKLDFITVLRRLINCSTPKTASYKYSLEKLLWNVKFYLKQYFSQISSHEIVRRNVKSTWEILNLDNTIKHLSPVYEKKTSKSCADDSKASLVWVKKTNWTRPNPVPKSLFLGILDMVPSAKIFPLCTYL